MNVTRVLVLVVAAVAGGAAFYLSTTGGTPEVVQQVRPAAQEVAMKKVLFAQKDLAQGAIIEEGQTKWVEWPAKNVPDFYITEDNEEFLEALPEMRARIAIQANEPIYEKNTVRHGDRGMMAAIMSPGMRAVTVKLDPEQVSGGFVLPGDRVDVFASVEQAGRPGEDEMLYTSILLSNVRVLAIDQVYEQDEDTPSITGKTVTLEVAPAQVQRFVNAREAGQLTVVLRSVFDGDVSGDVVDEAVPDEVVVIRYGQG